MGLETLALISAGLSIAGGVQSLQEGNYQAKIAEEAAKQTLVETEEAKKESKRKTNLTKSKQILGYLKSGVQLEGTPLDIVDLTEQLGKEDVASIERQGQARARQLRMQGGSARLSGRARFLSGIATAGVASAPLFK